MVVDRVVAPPEFRAQFSEKLMVLPYSYFCNDHRQQPAWAGVPSAAVQRADYAELPARGVLLACFNQVTSYPLPPVQSGHVSSIPPY
jgi:predicted O-linked N-acetylglucosamine transferase (SPINDLY family)